VRRDRAGKPDFCDFVFHQRKIMPLSWVPFIVKVIPLQFSGSRVEFFLVNPSPSSKNGFFCACFPKTTVPRAAELQLGRGPLRLQKKYGRMLSQMLNSLNGMSV